MTRRPPASPPRSAGRLPTIAAADPAEGARAIARLLPAAIARAEAMDLGDVASLLEDALRSAERIADRRGSSRPVQRDRRPTEP